MADIPANSVTQPVAPATAIKPSKDKRQAPAKGSSKKTKHRRETPGDGHHLDEYA